MRLIHFSRPRLAHVLCALGLVCAAPALTAQEAKKSLPETQSPADSILALTRDSRIPTAAFILDTLAPARSSETLEVLQALGSSQQLPVSALRELLADTLILVPAIALERKRAGKNQPGERTCALLILRELGGSEDVKTMLELVAPAPEVTVLDPLTAEALRSSLGPLLGRDERAYTMVERQYARIHDALAPTLIATIGDRRSAAGLDVLLAWLAHGGTNVRLILAHINRTAARLEPVLPESSLLRVRLLLASDDESVRREAALAVGRLNDFDSLSELISMVEEDTRSVRDNAHWSLKHMTKLGVRPERWIGWYQSEFSWWRDEAPALLNSLTLDSPADLIPAINEISHHRLFRKELAFELTQLLHHPNPNIVRLTCSALRSLQSRSVVKALVPLVEHPDEAVCIQACAALRTITGKDLPCDRRSWEQAVL